MTKTLLGVQRVMSEIETRMPVAFLGAPSTCDLRHDVTPSMLHQVFHLTYPWHSVPSTRKCR